MKEQEKTAGKTAIKTRNINTERIERWRRHLIKYLQKMATRRKSKMGFDIPNMLEPLQMCANAEGLSMEDLVIRFISKSRANGEVRYECPKAHSDFYYAESNAYEDTRAEQCYSKRELYFYDEAVIKDAVWHINDNVPHFFRHLSDREKKELMLFYKIGDCGLMDAIFRVVRVALLETSRSCCRK